MLRYYHLSCLSRQEALHAFYITNYHVCLSGTYLSLMSRPPVEVRINELVFFSPSGWTSERGNAIEVKMDPPALVDLVNFRVKSVSLGGAYDLSFWPMWGRSTSEFTLRTRRVRLSYITCLSTRK
jgi:hypothetical protein